MESLTRPSSPDDLTASIETVGGQLQESLRALTAGAGGTTRPSNLVRNLGLDKSLAGRIVRALRSETAAEFLHWVPSPQGLRIVLDRAAKAGVGEAAVREGSEAVSRFQSLIEQTVGGRATIDAHIGDSRVEVRRRREETCKQSVYRGMSYLLGYSADCISTTLIIGPSGDGESLDAIELHHRVGMRRVRPKTPLAFLSVRFPASGGPSDPAILSLEGRPGAEDPLGLMLPAFSGSRLPRLEILRENGHTVFVLPEDDPSLAEPVNLSSGFHIRRGWPASRASGVDNVARGYLLHYPCRLLVRDLFLAESVFGSLPPELTIELPNPAGGSPNPPKGRMARVSTLDFDAPLRNLQPGLRDLWVRGAPRYEDLVRHGFERAGWDPAAFRGYRCTMSYPVPMLMMNWWMALPERNG